MVGQPVEHRRGRSVRTPAPNAGARRGQLALGHGPGGQSSSAIRSERCSGASARYDSAIAAVGSPISRRSRLEPSRPGRTEVGLQEPAADEAADPLRREVLVADDRRSRGADGVDGHLRQLSPPSRAGRGSAPSPRPPGRRRRPAPRPAAGTARRRARGGCAAARPSAASAATSRRASAARPSRAARGRARPPSAPPPPAGTRSTRTRRRRRTPVDGRARTVPELIRPRALVELPAVAELRQADHPRDRRLAHLGRPRQHGEAESARARPASPRALVSARTPGELERCADVGARARPDVLRDNGSPPERFPAATVAGDAVAVTTERPASEPTRRGCGRPGRPRSAPGAYAFVSTSNERGRMCRHSLRTRSSAGSRIAPVLDHRQATTVGPASGRSAPGSRTPSGTTSVSSHSVAVTPSSTATSSRQSRRN